MRFDRIILDVMARPHFVVGVAQERVPIVLGPEWTASAQALVRLARGVGLQLVHDPGKRRGTHLEQNVDMVGHHDPGTQVKVPLMIEPHRLLHDLSDLGASQGAFTAALVQVILKLEAAGAVVFEFEQRGPFGTQAGRERIGQAEGDELNKARLVAVREIPALVPAAEAKSRVFGVGRWCSAATGGNSKPGWPVTPRRPLTPGKRSTWAESAFKVIPRVFSYTYLGHIPNAQDRRRRHNQPALHSRWSDTLCHRKSLFVGRNRSSSVIKHRSQMIESGQPHGSHRACLHDCSAVKQ